jgi:hypothetical protein
VSEASESVITAVTLRTAIRARISAGISRRAISLLIDAYASPSTRGRHDDDTGMRRLPVEVIAHERRAAFLGALGQLQDDDALVHDDRLAG